MTRLFVAGGAGFIGSNFIRQVLWARSDWEVLNFDKLTYSGNLENIADVSTSPRYQFLKGDIADQPTLFAALERFQPDYIINFAAETHVDRSIHFGALEFIQTNIVGVFNFLEAVKKLSRIKKYVQVSTDETYGALPLDRPDLKFSEDMPFRPNVPYAATKAGGDLLCRAYFSTWQIPVIVTHCSNNYGPYQYPEKLIPYFVTRIMEGKTLPLYGDGKYVRDWIHVSDHCRALELCLLEGKPGEVYNIGADNERSNLGIAHRILDFFGKDDSHLEFVGDRPGHDRRYAIDATKIYRELGWKPTQPFDKGLRATIQWYVDHADWTSKIRAKTGVFNPHIDLWEAHKAQQKSLNP